MVMAAPSEMEMDRGIVERNMLRTISTCSQHLSALVSTTKD